MKAIILARVSTEEQMREGQSIPAQLARSREHCQRKGLEIKSEYQFDESSTIDQRKKFELVIEEIKQSKEKLALIVECVDRLQRSFKESVLLDEFRKQDKVELHFIRENLVIHKESNSSEIQRWDLAVFIAKSYVLQISDNVKRSQEQKLRSKEWPGKAPFGYKNIPKDDGKKDIVIDEFNSKVIRKMFEWYATRAFSMRLIKDKLKKDYGLKFSLGQIDQTFKNPFYYGLMRFKGQLYTHRYEPIITKELFDKVQEVKAGYHKKRFKFAGLPYAYRGLIRCADCGCMVTPEKKKGKYVYYHCTEYHGKHGARWLREKDLTKQFASLFEKIRVPQIIVEEITESLQSVHQGKSEFRQEQSKSLYKEKEKYAKRLENLYLDKLDGSITPDEYSKFFKEFRGKIEIIDTKLANLQKAEDNYYLTANYLLQLANRAYDLFKSSEVEEKRQLLKLLLQNCTLEGKKVRYTLQKPFDTILNYASRSEWLPG